MTCFPSFYSDFIPIFCSDLFPTVLQSRVSHLLCAPPAVHLIIVFRQSADSPPIPHAPSEDTPTVARCLVLNHMYMVLYEAVYHRAIIAELKEECAVVSAMSCDLSHVCLCSMMAEFFVTVSCVMSQCPV